MSDATIHLTNEGATTATQKPSGKSVARITLAAIALLVAAGGWYGYQRVHGTASIPMAAAGDFLPDNGAPRVGFGGRPIRPGLGADGVNVMPGNVVTARAGGATLRGTLRADGKWQVSVNRPGEGVDRAAVELVLQTRRRLLDPRRPQADVKVTDAQLAALASAVPEVPPELTPDALKRAGELLGQLTKLPPTDAKAEPLKTELQAIVATAAKADVSAIATEYASRAAKIRAILSAEQVQALLGQRPARSAAATTKPAMK